MMLLSVALIDGVFASFACAQTVTEEDYRDRAMLVYVPSHLPTQGSRALVVVLHGGLGNARNIESRKSESGLNMDSVAEKAGFIVRTSTVRR